MDKASPQLEGYDDWLQSFLADIPPSERLAGLAPAQRLAGLAPAQRLAGLDPAQQILALSDDALQMLPDSFFATLPPEVQSSIRARIGRP